MRLVDWLTAPRQRLATLVGGEVFSDADGSLATRREALRWYPDDVWRYVLAAAWLRISQEEAFVGRTGEGGDDLGRTLVAARLARDLLRLAFLVERRWAPYTKWIGAAFALLPISRRIGPHLHAAVRAEGWREREAALCTAQRELAVPPTCSAWPSTSTPSLGSSSTGTSGCCSATASAPRWLRLSRPRGTGVSHRTGSALARRSRDTAGRRRPGGRLGRGADPSRQM